MKTVTMRSVSGLGLAIILAGCGTTGQDWTLGATPQVMDDARNKPDSEVAVLNYHTYNDSDGRYTTSWVETIDGRPRPEPGFWDWKIASYKMTAGLHSFSLTGSAQMGQWTAPYRVSVSYVLKGNHWYRFKHRMQIGEQLTEKRAIGGVDVWLEESEDRKTWIRVATCKTEKVGK